MEETVSIKDMYSIDRSKIDSNDRRQLDYLIESEREHPSNW